MELVTAAVSKLELTLGRIRQLPEVAIRKMASSLQSKGQLSPVVAAAQGERLVLIDGFIRVLAAQRLGLVELVVEVVQVSGAQMKAQIYLRNRERGLALVEEFRLVRELVEVDGLSQVEVADLIERHKSWVCRRLAMVRRLSTELLGAAEIGRLPARSLSQLAQLPVRNQEEVHAAAHGAGLAGRDVGLLADLWHRAPDPVARAWVLKHPSQAIACARGKSEQPVDPRLGADGEALRRALGRLCRASAHVTDLAHRGLATVEPEGFSVLRAVHERARQRTEEAMRRVSITLDRSND